MTVILGSLTAIQLGIKKSLAILGFFAGNVARVAFGGVLRASFAALRLLFGGLVKRAGKLGGLGGVGQTVRGVIDFIIGQVVLSLGGKVLRFILKRIPFFKNVKIPETAGGGKSRSGGGRRSRSSNKSNASSGGKSKGGGNTKTNFNNTKVKTGTVGSASRDFFSKKMPKFNYPGPIRTAQDLLFRGKEFITAKTQGLNPLKTARNVFNRGKNFIGDGVKAVSKSGVVKNATKLMKGISKTGAGKFLGKALGPLYTAINFFSELMGEGGGLVSALSSVGGYLAGAKIGAIAFGSIGALFGGVGAAPLAFIGGLIGGIAGETVMKSLSKKIMSALGMKDIKVFNREKKDEVEGVTADPNNIEAVKNGNLDAANKISDFSEDKPQVIDLSQNTTDNSGAAGGGAVTEEDSNTIPDISFNNDNTHVLAATVNYGF